MSSRAVVTVVAVVLALSGCGTSGSGSGEPKPVRTDIAPLTKRFAALGTPREVHWLGAAAGTDSGRVPGPTDVHIQALVVLDHDVAEPAVRHRDWKPAPAGWTDAIPADLAPYLPDPADWQTGPEFTDEMTAGAYAGIVHLDRTSGTVYLDVTGR